MLKINVFQQLEVFLNVFGILFGLLLQACDLTYNLDEILRHSLIPINCTKLLKIDALVNLALSLLHIFVHMIFKNGITGEKVQVLS